MLADLRIWLGGMWGSISTHLLAIGMGLAALDPGIFSVLPHGQLIVAGIAVAVVILRNACPPPPKTPPVTQ